MNIAIIGAGISGLSAAYRLKELSEQKNKEINITVFEKGSSAGGSISTVEKDGFIIEEGADSFITTKPWVLELTRKLGIDDQIIPTDEMNRRTFVYYNKRLQQLPEGFFLMAPSNFVSFLKSNFFSPKAKFRVLAEQLIPPKTSGEEESLESFIKRRFGTELFEKVAQPLIGGIYTGDAKKLSAGAVLPEFVSMENEFGSVISGIRSKYKSSDISRTESGARYGIFASFKNGLSTLPKKIIESTKDIKYLFNTEVVNIEMNEDGWTVKSSDGVMAGFDAVILAVSGFISSQLLKNTDAELSDSLGRLEYASSVVINIAISEDQLSGIPGGFGVVIPETENLNMIACSFNSRKYRGRAAEGYELIRCFAGGALNPEFVNKGESEITTTLLSELEVIFNKGFEPEFVELKRYINAMPQYNLGYSEIIKKIWLGTNKLKTIALAGNSYGGVGIPDCINSGNQSAELIYANLT